jgi:sugar transferase EpsL
MKDLAKRLFDIAVAGGALLALAPMLLVVAALVRLKLGAPVLFRQIRPGLGGVPFEMIKFRTMTDARDESGRPRPDEERLTPFGRMLRSTSVDELPELWNVLRGEMSLVGPRPLLLQYRDRYSPWQRRRLEAKPGITGWAQVNGWRGNTSLEKRIEFDLYYIENWSLSLDFKIMWLTLLRGFHRIA